MAIIEGHGIEDRAEQAQTVNIVPLPLGSAAPGVATPTSPLQGPLMFSKREMATLMGQSTATTPAQILEAPIPSTARTTYTPVPVEEPTEATAPESAITTSAPVVSAPTPLMKRERPSASRPSFDDLLSGNSTDD
jgi:hypothetical protein